jgi:hypothetical protein
VNHFYPYGMNGTSSERMQTFPSSHDPLMEFDQDHTSPYRMTGLNPLQMSGINEDELMPMNMSEMHGMQQGQSPYNMYGMEQDPADMYGMQQGQNPYGMYGMQPGSGGQASHNMLQGNPWQMSDMPSMNPYQSSMDTGQMGGSGSGNQYTQFTEWPYGQQYSHSPQGTYASPFMHGQGNPGYGSELPYGSPQPGFAEGYYGPAQSYGGYPSQGYGMPGGPFGMGAGPGMRYFW